MGATFLVVCLTPQRRLIECIMGSYSIVCCLRNYLFVLFVCMLLDCYIRQESRASWSSYYTDYFTMSNGVKQGGVVSAILFILYLDKLLIRLKILILDVVLTVVILEPYHTLMVIVINALLFEV